MVVLTIIFEILENHTDKEKSIQTLRQKARGILNKPPDYSDYLNQFIWRENEVSTPKILVTILHCTGKLWLTVALYTAHEGQYVKL